MAPPDPHWADDAETQAAARDRARVERAMAIAAVALLVWLAMGVAITLIEAR
jgi:hypothetical protein